MTNPILISSIWFIMNCRAFWIGLCLGIPILVALFVHDEWDDASIRRASNTSDDYTCEHGTLCECPEIRYLEEHPDDS